LAMDPEEAYLGFQKSIESVNVIISTYQDERIGDVQVNPEDGTVAFGSGLQAWGFTLKQFAKVYAAKFKTSRYKMRQRLWGNNFFVADEAGKTKWVKAARPPKDGKTGKNAARGFVRFIMEPIYQVADACIKSDDKKLAKMLKGLDIELKGDDKDLREKHLLKRIMQKWLPAGDAILEMIVMHLPSPRKAQKYRSELLYEGPNDDEAAIAMRNCDPKGHLMMYISKMVPTAEPGRFYAFGRVFSGTIATGQKVRIMGPNYVPGKKTELWVKNIQRTLIMMGRFVEQVPDIPAGNTCGLVGVDQYLIKSGTITTFEGAHNIRQMKYSVSPVVRVAVEVKNAADLPKLVEGLKRLAKSDPLVVISMDQETGQNVIAGAGELHLEICLKDLQEDFMGGAEIKVSDPVVAYRETVREESSEDCLSKSPNKHNRLIMRGAPMPAELQDEIEDGTEIVSNPKDARAQARYVYDHYEGIEAQYDLYRKLWGFGPDTTGANWMIDTTTGVSYLEEIKESVNSGFQWATKSGPLCDEPMRGCIFRLMDVTLHSDSIHRGMGQIMPAARKCIYACVYTGSPTLMEPYFIADISVPVTEAGAVYTTISGKRGTVIEDNPRTGTPMTQIKAHLPINESFGFDKDIRKATGGQAFPQLAFSHWNIMAGDCFTAGNKVYEIITETRKRKGMKEVLPPLADYLDKL